MFWMHRAFQRYWAIIPITIVLLMAELGTNFTSENPAQNGLTGLQNIFRKPAFQDVLSLSKLSGLPAHGGVSWADYNGDGWLDLLLPSPTGIRLYKNNGGVNFTDVTVLANLEGMTGVYAGIFGDFDNDGCPDLFLSRNGFESKFPPLDSVGLSDLLYKNNCNGTFTDISRAAGIIDSYHGEGASWVDYNGDGLLDIYVVNIGRWQDQDHWIKEPNLLYRNNGNGTFTEVGSSLGLSGYADCPSSTGEPDRRGHWKLSFQPIWFDFNNDLIPDLFVSTDGGISPLYQGETGGKFKDVTNRAGLCRDGSGMGATAGDFNNDGFTDLYVTNNGRHFLWKNNGNGTFREISEPAGVAYAGAVGWGTGFLDYDNDGFLDLYAVSGALTQNDATFRGDKLHDKLFRNIDGQRFNDVSAAVGITGNFPKLSAAFGDYDNDGFTDIVVIANSKKQSFEKFGSRLYHTSPNGNHWLTVSLEGTRSNRNGIGAKVILKAGGKKQIREVISGSSYIGQNSLWQTFGLGSQVSRVEELEVDWPSGIKQFVRNVETNRKIIISESEN